MKTLGITAAILAFALAACSDDADVAPVEPVPAPVEPGPVPVEPTPVPDPENLPTEPIVVPPIELGDEPAR